MDQYQGVDEFDSLVEDAYAQGMHISDVERSLIVFRLGRRFPPEYPADYIPIGSRRSFAAQPEAVQRAAQGLSVYSTLDAVTRNAQKCPRLGAIVARYSIPTGSSLEMIHLVGRIEHLTVLGEISMFHALLDESWRVNLDIMQR